MLRSQLHLLINANIPIESRVLSCGELTNYGLSLWHLPSLTNILLCLHLASIKLHSKMVQSSRRHKRIAALIAKFYEVCEGKVKESPYFFSSQRDLHSVLVFLGFQVVQGTLQAGHMLPLRNNKTHSIADKFLLGGSTTIRGFEMGGIGPHADGFALGAEVG